MMVCAHGKVSEYCENHDMYISETWDGSLRDYNGRCRVVVTDSEMSENEYYYLKGLLLARGIELISTRHKDDQRVSEYLVYAAGRKNSCGRRAFADEDMIRRMREMRDKGMTLREIQAAEGIRRSDGSMLSLSTIQKYTKK